MDISTHRDWGLVQPQRQFFYIPSFIFFFDMKRKLCASLNLFHKQMNK